jgi:hypothetical protein
MHYTFPGNSSLSNLPGWRKVSLEDVVASIFAPSGDFNFPIVRFRRSDSIATGSHGLKTRAPRTSVMKLSNVVLHLEAQSSIFALRFFLALTSPCGLSNVHDHCRVGIRPRLQWGV